MSKPLGTKQATKDHKSRKNPHMADTFAAKRHAKNAERPKQVWSGACWLHGVSTINGLMREDQSE